MCRIGWGVLGRGEREAEDAAGVGGIDDTVIPEACRGVIRMALGFVLLAQRLLEGFLLLLAPLVALALDAVALDGGQDARGLFATHDRDTRVGPHPEKPR